MLTHTLAALGVIDLSNLHTLVVEVMEVLSVTAVLVWRVEKLFNRHNEKLDAVLRKINPDVDKTPDDGGVK